MDIHRLGRSVVIRPGDPVPAGWEDCDRRAVVALSADLAAELYDDWLARRPLVIELAAGIGLDDPVVPPAESVAGRQPWEWPVDLDLPGERLHHAVWSNSVDGRQPSRLRWRWAEEAVRAGADPAGGAGVDVRLPDGRPAVCDGGPLDAGLPGRIGRPVLHRVSIEHRHLRPLGDPAGPEGAPGDLAPDQRAAVTEARAGARVIAPAGSGKTRVLTERARRLISGWGLPPAALALVAYNVRAASEMRERLADLPELRIRTLNALGLRLCGRATTIEEPEVRRILSGLVPFPRRAETDPAAPWIEALSRLRLGLAGPVEVEGQLADVSDLDTVARAYRAELSARGAADFDEQVAAAIERLLADPVFRARSQRFARVLLVDEFQDLTPAHMLLIRLLTGPAGSVFAVGDDDQTIYGYAGATPRWLVDFPDWFPGSAAHSLEVNYRCPAAVVTAASNLLSRNAVRVPKSIRAAKDEGPTGDTGLTVLEGGDRPSTRTAERVEEILSGGAGPAEVAVLSRVNASLVPVQVLLRHRGIPVGRSADGRFLHRSGVRAALAWLEVAAAPDATLPGAALREAARRPRRGMSSGLLDLLARPRRMDSLEGLAGWLQDKGSQRDADKVDGFVRDVTLVRRAAGRGTAAVLRVVRNQVGGAGLDASATALDQWSHGAIAAHLDDLDALAEMAALEPDPGRFPSWLTDRLGVGPDPGGVTLASIHSVKGQEWPFVVVHHASAGLLPHRLATDGEEERRIFHVALTRALRSASVVTGAAPSPLVAELAHPGVPVRPDVGRPASSDTRRPGPAAGPQKGVKAPAAELLPATEGATFQSGGQDHQVVTGADDGAICLIGGGPARTRVGYGTAVTANGRPAVLAHPAAREAWEQLRAWRSDKAKTLELPAYVVFDDATLRQIAVTLPANEPGLLSIRGVGPVKLDAYGSELLDLTGRLRAGNA